ncbi:MAG TPA: hypothetical protein VNT76_11555 [Candidatus Binatus sp.]|nr:hypothetical protein [Candidatus Binatus sp.]
MAYETGLNMEERVTSLFQPDTLLPDQYLDTYKRKLHLEPEKKLMLAILEDAIACYQKYIFARESKGKALFRETEDWVFAKDENGIFSFDSVCEILALDPDYVRRGLVEWKRNAANQHSQAKVYQLTARPRKHKREVSVSRRARHRLKRVVNR